MASRSISFVSSKYADYWLCLNLATIYNMKQFMSNQGAKYKGRCKSAKNPLIRGLFTCHKNPSAPSALSRPLHILRRLLRFSPKARGSFEAGITPGGHICVLINLVWHRGGRWDWSQLTGLLSIVTTQTTYHPVRWRPTVPCDVIPG